MSTELVIADLTAALTAACGRRRPTWRADAIVTSHLRPHVPAGLWGWYVRPMANETTRAYARRAVLHLVARASSAGMACSLRHHGAEHVGMLEGHVLPAGAGCALVGAY